MHWQALYQRPQFWVVVFLGLVCLSHIHQGALAVDAIRYAHMAREIGISGTWWQLTDSYRHVPYANKPPLLFWLLAGLFQAFGYSTFVAKLLPAIFSFLTGYLLCRAATLLNSRAGILAVLLYVVNRSFAKDLVDLGFDSMALLGMMLLLLLALKLALAQSLGTTDWALAGVGTFLVSQSKPPYLLFALPPMLFLIASSRDIRAQFLRRRNLLLILGPLIPSICWFTWFGIGFLHSAYTNQIGESLRFRAGYLQNLGTWLHSLLFTLSPLSIVAACAAVAPLLNPQGRRLPLKWRNIGIDLPKLTHQQVPPQPLAYRVLLLWFFQCAAIILFVACRPRYLWPTLLPGIVLGAAWLQAQAPCWFEEARLTRLLMVLSCLIGIAVITSVPLHRNNPVVQGIKELQLEGRNSPMAICINLANQEEERRIKQQTDLLLQLEFGKSFQLQSSRDVITPHAEILANDECLRELKIRPVWRSKTGLSLVPAQ